jgi:uncharacterized repeat protein (TIGR01451 family)
VTPPTPTDTPTATFTPSGTPPTPTPTGSATSTPPSATGTPEIGIYDPVIVKLADPALAKPGETVTYTITVTNRGTAPGYSVVVTDPVPSVLRVIRAETTQGTYTINGQQVTFNLGTLLPGRTITMRVYAEIRPGVVPPIDTVNTACLNNGTCSSGPLRITSGSLPATGEHPDEPPFNPVPFGAALIVATAAVAALAYRRTRRAAR